MTTKSSWQNKLVRRQKYCKKGSWWRVFSTSISMLTIIWGGGRGAREMGTQEGTCPDEPWVLHGGDESRLLHLKLVFHSMSTNSNLNKNLERKTSDNNLITWFFQKSTQRKKWERMKKSGRRPKYRWNVYYMVKVKTSSLGGSLDRTIKSRKTQHPRHGNESRETVQSSPWWLLSVQRFGRLNNSCTEPGSYVSFAT